MNVSVYRVSCIVLVFLLLGWSAPGAMLGENPLEPPEDWREIAQKHGLSAEDIARLERDGILVTNDTYKQVFSAYVSGTLPLFITSDSLLNAYHVLYAESIRQLEMQRAKKMPDILRSLTDNLQAIGIEYEGDPELPSAARKRALLVLGIALRLLDDEFRLEDAELNIIVDEEIERVSEAEGSSKPEWLGPPDSGFTSIDYSRYKPRGFYTSNESLRRYFQAVAWLQSIPFRVNNDEEFFALLLLAESIDYVPPAGKPGNSPKSAEEMREMQDQERINEHESRNRQLAFARFFSCYESIVGPMDDWDLTAAPRITHGGSPYSLESIGQLRESILKKLRSSKKRPRINDQVANPPREDGTAQEPSFRVLSAYRTPSAVLFHETTNSSALFQRAFPEGLEVCTALGSSFARKTLDWSDKDVLLAAIDATKPEFEGGTLYHMYLKALSTLLDEPPKQAPPFMSTTTWQAKSCNTALAGWAQLRHTFVLQAKQTAHFLGMEFAPPGFIEPDPEFYGRMGDLVERTTDLLADSGAFSDPYGILVEKLKSAETALHDVANEEQAKEATGKLNRDHHEVSELLFWTENRESRYGREQVLEEVSRKGEKINELIAALETDGLGLNEHVRGIVQEYTHELEPLWYHLALLCRRMETLAYKQLHGIPLTESERIFIKGYGIQIARLMFYQGNSYLSPRDDAPRIVDVYSNPNFSPINYLESGIARPRKMYVLYPWQGKSILCVGAVLPYYEFRSTARLTDSQWQELLDSDFRPPVPEWAKPIYRGEGLGKPEMVDRH